MRLGGTPINAPTTYVVQTYYISSRKQIFEEYFSKKFSYPKNWQQKFEKE